MSWWDVRNPAGTFAVSEPDAQSAAATGTVLSGPYASQQQAQAALPGAGAATGSGAGGTGAQAIYRQLLGAGFSTIQAIGAMANAIAESRLDPESVGDGGTSFGLWQFHVPSYPDAASLVTGNPAADITRQVAYLRNHVSGSALAGNSGGEVAGNFASNFERCTTCSHGNTGPNGWSTRVANAATVQGWISSGNWPTSSGTGTIGTGASGGGTGGLTVAQLLSANPSPSSRCLVGGNAFIPCLLDASQARGLIGGLCMLGGGLLFLGGLVLVVAMSGLPGAAVARSVPVAGALARR